MISRVESDHRRLENVSLVTRELDVVNDGLQPPPDRVSAVVPRIPASIQQVGDETMTKCTSISQDDVSCLCEPDNIENFNQVFYIFKMC